MNPPVRRLAIVLSHPTQYYSPWFRWLRAHTTLVFRVFYLWDFGVAARRDPQFGTTFQWDVDLLSGYDHEFVPNVARDAGTHHFRGLQNPNLIARLAAWQPTAVLFFGYKWASPLRAILWARRSGLKLLFRGDSHFLGRGAPALPQRLLLRALYAQFDAMLCVGAANQDYFRRLGVPERSLYFSPHAVNDAWFNPALQPHHERAEQLRRELNLAPDALVVLFAGKFVAAKQPRELLEAFLAVRATTPRAALVFVGDGPEKRALIDLARQAPAGTVHFLPFANQSEMPARYLLADIFALPSRGHYETWGLAVNEAMHLGVPPLVSDLVGCQRDLVTDGTTGWVFNSHEPDALRVKLAAAVATVGQPMERERLRKAVTAHVAPCSYAATTAGLLAALGGNGVAISRDAEPTPSRA